MTAVLIVLVFITVLFLQSRLTTNPIPWQKIKETGVLTYGTRTSLLSYYINDGKPLGVEYHLLAAFCQSQNIDLNVVTFDNNSDLFSALMNQNIDIAGGHLSITTSRKKNHLFTIPFMQSEIQLITHFNLRNIQDMNELQQAMGIITYPSSNEEFIKSQKQWQLDNLSFSGDLSLFDLIKMISLQEIDYTLADSNLVEIYKHFLPGIYQPLNLTDAKDIAFMLHTESTTLKTHLDSFLKQPLREQLVKKAQQEVIALLPKIDTSNTVTFLDFLYKRWPKIVNLVQKVAKETNMDYLLLGAISYQESHWNPDAVSPTGVKGLMMLTQHTANEVGITNRTDPEQSLRGGAVYYKKMYRKIPSRIQEPDRTHFALAAYNIGYGHLEDARILTQKNGKNPDSWNDVATFLPQMNSHAIAKNLKHGPTDGKTAITYVNNIMTYHQLLKWKSQKGGW